MRFHKTSRPRVARLAPRALFWPTTAALALASSAAHATGFLTDQFGGDFGNPALGNVYSVYFNPAAMGATQGSDVLLDGIGAARTLSYTRTNNALSPSSPTEATNPTYIQANTGTATLFNVLAAPYLGVVSDLGTSRWHLGGAVYVPFGGTVSWQKLNGALNTPGAPGAYDGPQRWSTISLSLSSIYETVALSYTMPESHLSFGVSVSAIETQLIDSFAHNINGSDDILVNNAIAEGRAYVNVTGFEVGAAAGVHWQPTPKINLGLSYTSQPNFGTMRLSGSFQEYTGKSSPAINAKGDLLQAYPDVVRLGGAWRIIPEAELRLDLDYQRWSAFKDQCFVPSGGSCPLQSNGSVSGSSTVLVNLERNFQDAVRARLGGAYWIEPETQIFGSAAIESSPIDPKYVDPLVFDSVHVQGSLGVRHEFGKHVYASLSYTYVYYVPITVTDSTLNGYQAPSKQPNEDGSYSSALYLFDGAVGYHW